MCTSTHPTHLYTLTRLHACKPARLHTYLHAYTPAHLHTNSSSTVIPQIAFNVQVVRATGEAALKTINLDAETNMPVKPQRKLLDSLTGEFLDEHSYNTYQVHTHAQSHARVCGHARTHGRMDGSPRTRVRACMHTRT